MKKIILGLFFLFLFSQVYALDVTTDKDSYEKGGTIVISGVAIGDILVEIKHEGHLLFEKTAKVGINEGFNIKFDLDFTNPAGVYNILISDEVDTREIVVKVYPSKESELLVTRILSPAPGRYSRSEELRFIVEVTSAGNTVDDAKVFLWGFEKSSYPLISISDGKYSLDYKIPNDAPYETKNFVVTSRLLKDKRFIGGETSVPIQITKSAIVIEILEPKLESLKLGSKLPLKIKAKYSDGKSINAASASVNINGKKLWLAKEGDDVYSGFYEPTGEDWGLLQLNFVVKDPLNNIGENTTSVNIIGFVEWFIWKNIIWILLGLAIFGFVSYKFFNSASFILTKKSLVKTKDDLIEQKKKLQEDYFQKSMITRDTYLQKIKDLDQKISKIESETVALESKKVLKK